MAVIACVAAALIGALQVARCFGGSPAGEAPEIPSVLTDAISALGGGVGAEGEYLSPTCPHENPHMMLAHQMIINAVAAMVRSEPMQPVRAFAESEVGATALLFLANAACCPVSKGALTAGGWTITEVPGPEGEHPTYRIEREGVVLPR